MFVRFFGGSVFLQSIKIEHFYIPLHFYESMNFINTEWVSEYVCFHQHSSVST